MHPAFLGAQYPYSVTPPSLAATAVSFPVPSMAPITVHPYHTEPGLPLPTSVACEFRGQGAGEWRGGALDMGGRAGISSVPLLSHGFPSTSVSSVHPASTFPAIQGASLPALTTQPSPLVSGGFPPPEEETHSQPVNPHSLHHLHAAYRVGKKSLSVFSPRAE